MDPIRTLFDAAGPAAAAILPPELHRLYAGDLRFQSAPEGRPYVIGNFVSTLDGVVSFMLPGHAGGGDISGHNQPDRFIMGLLRASADAVIIGAGTLHATAPDHLWTAESIHPETAEWYRVYRNQALGKTDPPRTIIATASGVLDLRRAIFHTPGIRVHIITTPKGRERLHATDIGRFAGVEIAVLSESDVLIAPSGILRFLYDVLGVRLLVHEGGPTLFGEFVAAGLVDEFFLTLAPQLAGRSTQSPRPAMIAETAFVPETAPWLNLLSLKQCGSHLYLRYRRTGLP